MAVKKPIVMGANGRLQQLQSGDSINTPTTVARINGEVSVALTIGMPVYISSATSVLRAQANSSGAANAVLMTSGASISSGNSGGFVTPGDVVSATTTQWDAIVTGESGGLTEDGIYFLDPATAGFLTLTPPATAGQYITELGVALSTTDFLFNPRSPVLL